MKRPAGKGGRVKYAPGRIETVQLLRAIAVIAVMLSHAGHEITGIFAGTGKAFTDPFLFGNFGVDLFFVISGFIMVHTAWNQFGRPGASSDFLRRRLIRIVPLYWAATTAMIAIVIAMPQVVHTATADVGQWIASYFFIPYAREGDGLIRPVLGLGWSLEYEMFFYVVFAISLFLPRLAGLAFAGIAMAMTVVVATGFRETTIGQFLSHPIMLEFVAGMVLGVLHRTGVRIMRPAGVVLAIAGAWMIYTAPPFGPHMELMRHIHYGIPSILLVSAAALSEDDSMRAVFRPSVLVGEISYSAYLSHPFLVGALGYGFSHSVLVQLLPPEQFAAVFVPVMLVLGFVLAWMVHTFFDTPVTGWLRRRSHTKMAKIPAETAN